MGARAVSAAIPGSQRALTDEGWLAGPIFNEPGGIFYAGGKLYVADTNAHRIRIVDMKTRAVSTLRLTGVTAPTGVKK